MTAPIPGCHLVGSTGYPATATSIRKIWAGQPGRLKRIPDGETGARFFFTGFQWELFKAIPGMAASFEPNKTGEKKELSGEEIDEGIQKLKDSNIETGYDTAAIESYAVFKRLRDEGVVPQGVRFQVGLPTVASVVSPFVEAAFQPKAWPIYEEALFRALKNIQARIPHEDLAIQIDLAVDTAFWEGVLPTSRRGSRDFTYRQVPHPINFFHAPVPLSADDKLDLYLEPLKDLAPKLKEHNTELYLGVVHHADPEGTRKRIEVAKKYVPEFGVATECGWGRTPADQVDGIMELTIDNNTQLLYSRSDSHQAHHSNTAAKTTMPTSSNPTIFPKESVVGNTGNTLHDDKYHQYPNGKPEEHHVKDTKGGSFKDKVKAIVSPGSQGLGRDEAGVE
ncbi:hypothetical protein CLAFUR4_00139 [Fulvia fulva]|nr:hypothetical protein CLAFUR4_00139 [Fulvia fulva]